MNGHLFCVCYNLRRKSRCVLVSRSLGSHLARSILGAIGSVIRQSCLVHELTCISCAHIGVRNVHVAVVVVWVGPCCVGRAIGTHLDRHVLHTIIIGTCHGCIHHHHLRLAVGINSHHLRISAHHRRVVSLIKSLACIEKLRLIRRWQ